MHDEERPEGDVAASNPAVALTIDTDVHPPKILLIRGRAELDVVDGIPDEYLEIHGTYQMTPEQRVEWESEIRSLDDGMVRIVVTPTWAKLIDFETTLPRAIEELVRQRDEHQRSLTYYRIERLIASTAVRVAPRAEPGPGVRRRNLRHGRAPVLLCAEGVAQTAVASGGFKTIR